METQDHIDRVTAQWKSQGMKLDLGPVGIIGRAGRIMEYVDRALESKFEEFGISRGTFDVLAARCSLRAIFRFSTSCMTRFRPEFRQ
jgi:hypothetical protein